MPRVDKTVRNKKLNQSSDKRNDSRLQVLDIMSTAFVTFKTHGLDAFHFNQLHHGGALHCQEALGFKKFAKDRAKTDRARTLRAGIHCDTLRLT